MATYKKSFRTKDKIDPIKDSVMRLRQENVGFYQHPTGFNLNALPNNTGKTYSQADLFIRNILNN